MPVDRYVDRRIEEIATWFDMNGARMTDAERYQLAVAVEAEDNVAVGLTQPRLRCSPATGLIRGNTIYRRA